MNILIMVILVSGSLNWYVYTLVICFGSVRVRTIAWFAFKLLLALDDYWEMLIPCERSKEHRYYPAPL